jgi:hypothetical protein
MTGVPPRPASREALLRPEGLPRPRAGLRSATGALGRRTVATLILATWVVSLGWLVQRHYLGGGPGENVPRWPVPPGSAFHAIRLGGRQVGITTFTVDTLQAGLRVVELMTLDLPPLIPGTLRRTSLRLEGLYTRGLQLRTFQLDLLTEAGRETRTGAVEGDTILTVVGLPRGESAETLTVRLRRPVVLPSAIPLVAASRGLPSPGSRLNAEVFDPVNLELRVERITVAAESVFVVPDSADYNEDLRRWAVAHTDTVRAWRLDGTVAGLPVSRWIDGAGMVVRTEYPLGAVLDRSAFEMVQTNFRALPPPVWDSSASAPDYLPDDATPAARKRLTAVASLAAPPAPVPGGIAALEGGWQRRSGDTIRVGPPGRDATVDSLPDNRGKPFWSLALEDSSLKAWAAKAIGRESRPEAVARALNGWVRRSIALRTGPGTASMPRILQTGRGTAVERVLLLTALARSIGLPARPVWGLVRVKGRWQLRTWSEVWTGTWLPLDPADGPRGTDAGRVRLSTGGTGRMMDLAMHAGRLRLEVLEETK